MSTYATSEAALLTVIRLMGSGTTYTTANSSQGAFGVLNNKNVTGAVVLMMARASENGDDLGNGRRAQGKRQQRHYIAAIVFRARGQVDDGVSYTALITATDAIVAHLDTYQRLNNATNVKRAQVREVTEPRVQRSNAWIYQSIIVEVMTETSPVVVETAR